MQNPVFIQFKDFLKRSNSMVRIIEFCVFFHLPLECSFLKISSQCNGSISSLRPPTDLLVIQIDYMYCSQRPEQFRFFKHLFDGYPGGLRNIYLLLIVNYILSTNLTFWYFPTLGHCVFVLDDLSNSHQIPTDCLQTNLDCLRMSEICGNRHFWLGIRQLYADDTYIFLLFGVFQ